MKGPRIEIAPDIATNFNRCICITILVLTLFHFFVSYFTNWGVSLDVIHEQQITPQHDSEEVPDVEKFLPLLTFIPGKTPVISYPWVLVSSTLIEREIALLILVPLVVLVFGSYVEKIWGLREYMRYLVIISVLPNVSLYFYYETKSILLSETKPPLIFSGLSMAIGIIVAATKLIPNHQVYIFQDKGFRMKLFPSIIMGICGVTYYFSTNDIYKVFFMKAYLGFLVSWTYLRIFQKTASSAQIGLLPPFVPKKNRPTISRKNEFQHGLFSFNLDFNGDRSASFALSSFFPFPLSGAIGDISNRMFSLLVKAKIINGDHFEIVDNEPSLVSSLKALGLFQTSGMRTRAQQAWNWAKRKKPGHHQRSSVTDGKRKLALEGLE